MMNTNNIQDGMTVGETEINSMRTITPQHRTKQRRLVIEIAAIRDSKSLSQKMLAKMSGISETTIGKVESGLYHCYSFHNLIAISKALDIKLSDLLSRVDL